MDEEKFIGLLSRIISLGEHAIELARPLRDTAAEVLDYDGFCETIRDMKVDWADLADDAETLTLLFASIATWNEDIASMLARTEGRNG